MAFEYLAELTKTAAKLDRCPHLPIDHPAELVQEAEYWARTIGHCEPEMRLEHLRWLAKNDLYFLMVYILGIRDINTQWHLERCREIQTAHQGVFDLWSRGSGKSAIKTQGLIIQKILNDPDVCICIFSHTRPIAKDFLSKIKRPFESHELLRSLFPEIIWSNVNKAPVWSLDHGIMVQRESVTRGESTVEAWGLVDGQPTMKHYDWIFYDDIQKEKLTEYSIAAIDDAFQTSLGLGRTKPPKFTGAGVFFRGGSIYEMLIDRGVVIPRIRPAINANGTSPIWKDEEVRATMKLVTPAVLACEYLMDPTRKIEGEGFQESWLKYYDAPIDRPSSYVYMVVDPGKGNPREKTRGSKTAIAIIATRADRRFYLIDGVTAPMSLLQRNEWVLSLHRQYHPRKILYEHYGLQADIEALKDKANREGYQPEGGLNIFPCSAHVDKEERIEWLAPVFRAGDFILPKSLPSRRINDEDTNFLDDFLFQYRNFPATRQKDALDVTAWIMFKDAGVGFPQSYNDESLKTRTIDFNETPVGSWMSE